MLATMQYVIFSLDFIQQKCLILPEDISHTWTTILNSMAQMPYDAVKYKPKTNDTALSNIHNSVDASAITTEASPSNTNYALPEKEE
ncbi:unnamed protein product [Rotaria sp. Silwood2]|nr:unnamed protein product [Rotaria sp. Silwood2]CAF4352138.1 unnamed protein product [Rotaria sp. Silwood2]